MNFIGLNYIVHNFIKIFVISVWEQINGILNHVVKDSFRFQL